MMYFHHIREAGPKCTNISFFFLNHVVAQSFEPYGHSDHIMDWYLVEVK